MREAGRGGGVSGKPAGMERKRKEKTKNQKIDGETRVSGSHRCPPQSQKLQSRGPKGQCSSCSLTKGQEDGAALNAGGEAGGGVGGGATWGPRDSQALGRPRAPGGQMCSPIAGRCSAQRGEASQGPARVGGDGYPWGGRVRAPSMGRREDQLNLPCEVAGGSLSKGVSLSGTWVEASAAGLRGWHMGLQLPFLGKGTAHNLREATWFSRPSLLWFLQPWLGTLPGQRPLQFGFKKQSVTWAVSGLFESSLLAAAPA